MGVGVGGKGREVRGLRSTNGLLQNSHRDVKYSTGNEVTKELVHNTHEHEQRCGDCLKGRGYWVEGS